MYSSAAGPVCNLMAATGAVCDDQTIGVFVADRWQQIQLAYSHRDFVVFRFVTEGTCHAATTAVDHFNVEIWD